MNIFYLDSNPRTAAMAMTNKHVVKMILESAQLLSTAHHVLDGNNATNKHLLYKPTHVNHPSAVWVRESIENYSWLYFHFIALCEEYTARYGKVHATQVKLERILANAPINIPRVPATPVRLAISDVTHHVPNDPIKSYRNYYVAEKLKTNEDISRFNEIFML